MTHGHLLGNASLPFSPASILSLPAAAYKVLVCSWNSDSYYMHTHSLWSTATWPLLLDSSYSEHN